MEDRYMLACKRSFCCFLVLTQTNTGSVDVPKTVEGGICEVTTNTGDINLEVQ